MLAYAVNCRCGLLYLYHIVDITGGGGSLLHIIVHSMFILFYYTLANEVAKRYSNVTVRPSFRNILVNTLE